jgi:5-hydroxyisourate hydrolase-like protein (transthyretin family)
MTRAEKIKEILEQYKDINTVPALVKPLSMSRHGVRIYSNVLVENGLLEMIDLVPYQKVIKRVAYYRTDLPLTDALLKKVDADITAAYYKIRHLTDEMIAQRKAEKDKKIEQKLEQIKNKSKIKEPQKSEEEQNGIYKLSSAPSDYFKNKFEQQSRLERENFKSPKNYAGTSAGMLW